MRTIYCEFCNSKLDLESEKCAYCGTPNPHFKKREEGMKLSDVAVRSIVLAVLVVVLCIGLILHASVYDIAKSYQRSRVKANAEMHIKNLQEYLDADEYLEFARYCQKYDIRAEGEFEQFDTVRFPAMSYKWIYDELIRIYFSTRSRQGNLDLANLSTYLDTFYSRTVRAEDRYSLSAEELSENKIYLDHMRAQVRMLLQTYAHLTPEEAVEFETMSKSKRLIMLEERINGEE